MTRCAPPRNRFAAVPPAVRPRYQGGSDRGARGTDWPPRGTPGSAPRAEEFAEHRRRGGLADAAEYRRRVVAGRLGEDAGAVVDAARLGIGGAIINPGDPRERDRAGAHRARLESDVEVVADEAVRPECGAGRADRDDLGMRGRVVKLARAVAGGGDDPPGGIDDDRADRNLAAPRRRLPFGEGGGHGGGRRERHPPPYAGAGGGGSTAARGRPCAFLHDLPDARGYSGGGVVDGDRPGRPHQAGISRALRLLTGFDRYLARLILVPLLGCLTVAAMLLLLDKMLKLFDFVMNEGGPVSVVWKMLGNLIPEYLSLGIPIGVLLGILLAFRGLALSSEIDALRAVGVSYNRMLRVPLIFAVVFAGVSFFIVGFAEPYSRYAYEGLQFELRSGALGASIKVGEFARLAKNTTLRVEESRRQGADLRGLFVRTEGKNGQAVAVTAERGTFLSTDDPDIILLRLFNGTMVHTASTFAVPRVLTFKQQDLPVNLPAMGNFRARGDQDAELTLPELATAARSGDAAAGTHAENVASLWRRIALVAVVFVLPFLAVALAVPPKRSTSGLGVFLSIILLVVFFKTSQYGEAMGRIGAVDPVLAQVVPFVGFAAIALYLYYVLAFVPGGQPIGALDRAFTKLSSLVTGLIRRPVPWREATMIGDARAGEAAGPGTAAAE